MINNMTEEWHNAADIMGLYCRVFMSCKMFETNLIPTEGVCRVAQAHLNVYKDEFSI